MTNADYPAFPFRSKQFDNGDEYEQNEWGLTKREYFAAMAMQALITRGQSGYTGENAVMYADELLKALDQ